MRPIRATPAPARSSAPSAKCTERSIRARIGANGGGPGESGRVRFAASSLSPHGRIPALASRALAWYTFRRPEQHHHGDDGERADAIPASQRAAHRSLRCCERRRRGLPPDTPEPAGEPEQSRVASHGMRPVARDGSGCESARERHGGRRGRTPVRRDVIRRMIRPNRERPPMRGRSVVAPRHGPWPSSTNGRGPLCCPGPGARCERSE
jgi:hypothetical protein